MTPRPNLWIVCWFFVGFLPDGLAQEVSFKTDVDLVRILATVADSKGRLVTDLAAGDFELWDENQSTEITFFQNQSELPLSVGLLIDTSQSQIGVLELQRRAGYQFLDQVLRPQADEAFLISFDIEVELLQDLTSSRNALKDGLANLKVPIEAGRRGVGTLLYDAVFLAADEVLTDEVQRKALILISDGVDMGSVTNLKRSVEAAQRNDNVIYSIRYFDSRRYGNRSRRRGLFGGLRKLPDGAKILRLLAEETGGGYFEVSKKQSLAEILEQIELELRSQYVLGFPAAQSALDGFREIRLESRRKDLQVRARRGYYIR